MRGTIIFNKSHHLTVCLFLAWVIGSSLLVACGTKQSGPIGGQPTTGAAAPAPVVVAKVEQRDIPIQLTAIGNVEAYQTVQIRSQVNGQIEHIFFKEGEDVHKHQLLFQLDKRPFEADLDKATATLRHDEATAENSRVQAARYRELEKQGIISHEQADQLRAQAAADASAVNADKAAVEAARVQLQYTDIAAPIDGRTGALMINLGNLVKANDTPFLVQLNQVSPIYVAFSIPESNLDEVRRYFQSKQLRVLAFPKGQTTNPATGRLSFIDNGVDTTTGTVKLKASFPNKDRYLWPGEYVDTVLELSLHKNAVVVPTKAIQTGQQGEYVYVVTQDSTAQARAVKTSGSFQNLTLVSEGLQAGERVVVNGLLRVAPNAKVTIQSALPETALDAGSAVVNPPRGGGQ